MSSTESATPVGEIASEKSPPLSSVPSNLSNLDPNYKHDNEISSDLEGEDNSRQILRASTPEPSGAGLPVVLDSLSLADIKTCNVTSFELPPELDVSSPQEVFEARGAVSSTGSSTRFTLRKCHVPALGPAKTMAIYISGACESSNFQKVLEIPRPIGDMTRPGNIAKVHIREEKAGCAFIYKPGKSGVQSLALEREGPDGKTYKRTKTRAELRAALAALHFEDWYSEGWERVVLITSCEYVTEHATTSLPRWWERNWITKDGHAIKNQGFWVELSRVTCEYAKNGCEVCFWLVPEFWNAKASKAAVKAVADPVGEGFVM